MPTVRRTLRPFCLCLFSLLLLLSLQTGQAKTERDPSDPLSETDRLALILAPQPGKDPLDRELARLQDKIRANRAAKPQILQLGWIFVSKARMTGDPGYYKMAEECAQLSGDESASLLLRGHIDHALHRFAEAEAVAQRLVTEKNPGWQAYALLGDALMEQGKLTEAIPVYQRMIDLRPCLQTYARVAHLRWLKGDLSGAEELMRLAVEAGSSRDPEPAAWAYTRLALYQLQAHETKESSWSVDRALEFVKNYAAAMALRSKLEMERGQPAAAVDSLRIAVAQVPLPEYQWALIDAAELAGDHDLVAKTEHALQTRGASEDPRSFALYLASHQKDPALAFRLAEEELSTRPDVLSYDAVAWTALAAGRVEEASENMKCALAEGTGDARLFYHAGKIAAANGSKKEAISWIERAAGLQQMLLPSEKSDLAAQASNLGVSLAAESVQTTKLKMAQTASNKR